MPRMASFMLHPVTTRTLALAACGWLIACDAAALTLGRARGAVLVGRPLELAIPVTLDAADPDGPCADGELFYGDQKLSRPPSVRWEPGANRQGALRVSSPQVVDEPMVTLYLRVGCGQSVTRRFVLLAELPPEVEPAAPLVTVPARPSVAARQPRAGETAPRAAAEASPRAAAAAPGPSPAPARRRREPAAAAPPAPAPAARSQGEAAEPPLAATPPRQSRAAQRQQRAAAANERAAGRPRLQVDLLDLAPERDPTLRMSPELGPLAPADPQARQAAAALWAALRRTPEESLQEGLKLQALEQDLQSLRLLTQQNAAAVTQMRAQVEKAQSEKSQVSGLVFLLLAALAAMVGWAVWQWRRGLRHRPGRSWFEGFKPAPAGGVPPAAPLAGGEPPQPTDLDPTLPPSRPARAGTAAPAGQPFMGRPSENSEFQQSMGGAVRMVGVQELIDVHDKADFFLALGQHDQAVAVLEAHVHDQVETSALAWMDLLDMYHSLGKRVEYERLRAEFRQRFSVQVPDFDHFDQPSSSLENYGRALSRIVALWPSRRVLSVIEESIFRKPGLPGADPFSLEAYRELVLLYNIAREVAPPEDSMGMQLEYRPTDFPSTNLQPLSSLDSRPPPVLDEPAELPELVLDDVPDQATVVMGRVEQQTDRERLMIPPASPRIGLDIDLDAPASRPAPVDMDATIAPTSMSAPLDLDATIAPASRPPAVDLDATMAPTPLEMGAKLPPAPTEAPARPELPPLDFDTSALDKLLTEDPPQKPK